MGGLDDYINRLSNQELVNYILKETEEHPEIANKSKLDSLTVQYNINTAAKPPGHGVGADGGLHDFIFTLPRDKLTSWALTTEAYHRDVKHQHLMGGLDDYISSLTNQQIIDYIMREVKEHPEIANKDKLDALSTKYNIDINSVHEATPEAPKSVGPVIGGDGGLHDVLFRTDRDTLDKWALSTEKYHRQVNNLHLMGGLHDYINSLSNEQVIEYITKETKEHPEIASPLKLNALVTQFSVKTPSSVQTPVFNHDYIVALPRDTLEHYALATEKYHRQVNNLHLMGGLDDYIKSLSNEQITQYILKETTEHPEIANNLKLDGLVVQFGLDQGEPMISSTEPVATTTEPLMGGDGGLHDYIFRLPRDTLENWAIATEKYHRQVNNLHLMGGLHDYIKTLSNQQVAEYVMKEVKEHPEIASGTKLDSLVVQFGIVNKP